MQIKKQALSMRLALAAWISLIFGAGLIVAHPDAFSGQAFGASIKTLTTWIDSTPLATLPAEGGMAAAESDGLVVPNLLFTETLNAISTGAMGQATTDVQSLTTVENVNILNGLITAKLVVPISSSTGDGFTASSSGAGSALVDLVVGGVPIADGIAPNTSVPLPGVGYVVLNEQVVGGDGTGTSSLTVNMIHVVLQDALTGAKTGDIVVGSATSSVATSPVVPAHVFPGGPCVFYTGGVRIDADEPLSRQDFATAGFNATTRNSPDGCGPRGQLQYNDHHEDFVIHATSADIVDEDGFCARIHGTARVRRGNTQLGEHTYSAKVCDFDEPGRGVDTFEINLDGFVYHSSADCTGAPGPCTSGRKNPVLTGGNIQRHTQGG